jgi:hypothetical protein
MRHDMTDPVIDLTEHELDEFCPLVQNHLNPTAGWIIGDSPGCLFETYDDELDFVMLQDPG